MAIEGENVDISDNNTPAPGDDNNEVTTELDAVNAALDGPDLPSESVDDIDAGNADDVTPAPSDVAPTGDEKNDVDGKPAVDGDDANKGKPEETPEQKTQREAEEKAKADDPYATPDELNQEGREKTKERFEKLVAFNKEKDVALEQMQTQIGGFQEVIKSSGASAEEFGQLIEYSSLVKSGDPVNLQRALNILDSNRNAIAVQLGIDLPGADLLSEHPDLQKMIDNMEITRTGALEILKARTQSKQQEKQNLNVQQQEQQANDYQAAIKSAETELNLLDQHYQTNDPDYAFKRQLIHQQIPQIAQTYPPHQWKIQVQMLHQTISNTAGMVEQQNQTPKTPEPLRSSGSGNDGKIGEASTALEAVNNVLGFGAE